MNLIISDITWDTDNKPIPTGRIVQGYVLPQVVLVLDAPDMSDETQDRLTDMLSDWFDFCHFGFSVSDAKEYGDLTWAVDSIQRFQK